MNCKLDDIAVQVLCPFEPHNVGAMYRVKQPCGCHRTAWVVSPMQQVIEDLGLLGEIATLCPAGHMCCVWDNELRPIRPGEQAVPSTTKEKEPEHVV